MIDWLLTTIPLFKAVHIITLTIWCGGLLTLPLMLSRYQPDIKADDYRRVRMATHFTYIWCVTPAAVIAVISGTWLIFMRETLVPWFYAKLAFVTLLVAAHAWIGHIVVLVAERTEDHQPPKAWLPMGAVLIPIIGILIFVLSKPDLEALEFPAWLQEPSDGELLFEVPKL